MNLDLNQQHLNEILLNKESWDKKPIVQKIYQSFFERVSAELSPLSLTSNRKIVEIGSGMGMLKSRIPDLITTDLFPNPWIDLACTAYSLPFEEDSVSDILLIDVFHHLERPFAFLKEASRVLLPGGRVILLEPFISLTSFPVFEFLHPEPVGKALEISLIDEPPKDPAYYAAQGNATHIFFNKSADLSHCPLSILKTMSWSCWNYLLSGGFSKSAFYPKYFYHWISVIDKFLSHFPTVFAGRCLVVLEKPQNCNT